MPKSSVNSLKPSKSDNFKKENNETHTISTSAKTIDNKRSFSPPTQSLVNHKAIMKSHEDKKIKKQRPKTSKR